MAQIQITELMPEPEPAQIDMFGNQSSTARDAERGWSDENHRKHKGIKGERDERL